jgi:hypothetical protein
MSKICIRSNFEFCKFKGLGFVIFISIFPCTHSCLRTTNESFGALFSHLFGGCFRPFLRHKLRFWVTLCVLLLSIFLRIIMCTKGILYHAGCSSILNSCSNNVENCIIL